jgi:hypothetical protein
MARGIVAQRLRHSSLYEAAGPDSHSCVSDFVSSIHRMLAQRCVPDCDPHPSAVGKETCLATSERFDYETTGAKSSHVKRVRG